MANLNGMSADPTGMTHGSLERELIMESLPFIQRGDSAYVVVEGPTWEQAEANAQKLGGHLVTINDAEENNFIRDYFSSYVSSSSGGADFWIGLTDRGQEGSWKWENIIGSMYY